MERSVPSPCIRQCCLDEQDICLGCFRSLQEILDWTSRDDDQKREILHITEQRREQKIQKSQF